MERYEVYKYKHAVEGGKMLIGFLVYWTDDIDDACDKAYEIEKEMEKPFFATGLYDTKEKKYFGFHEKGTAFVIG